MKRIVINKKSFCLVIFSIIFLFSITGCSEYQLRELHTDLTEIKIKAASAALQDRRDDPPDGGTLEILKILQDTNTASTPINPFALPIGIGLTGIITVLEALRRKEKDGRKYAEHELKNGNGNNGK